MSPASDLELVHDRGVTRIWIGSRALGRSLEALEAWLDGHRVFVVTSTPVRRLHGNWLSRALEQALETHWLEVADGEAGKNIETVAQLSRKMVVAGGKRDSRLMTLGGGTVGDVGGFVASCFLRGIEYCHVPTTLLAQADAAIGGKTGINLPEAKNSVGAFHQPRFVVADAEVLETLGRDQIRQGLFEVIKAAVLADAELFEFLEERLPQLLSADAESLSRAVEAAVAVKIAVVAADEREGNQRRLLNLGHTLGHALETAAGHGGLAHGDAVGHGMRFAVELARRRGMEAGEAARIDSILDRMTPAPLPAADPDAILRILARDKKARESGLSWIVPTRIGAAEVVDDLEPAAVDALLASFLTGSVQSG